MEFFFGPIPKKQGIPRQRNTVLTPFYSSQDHGLITSSISFLVSFWSVNISSLGRHPGMKNIVFLPWKYMVHHIPSCGRSCLRQLAKQYDSSARDESRHGLWSAKIKDQRSEFLWDKDLHTAKETSLEKMESYFPLSLRLKEKKF